MKFQGSLQEAINQFITIKNGHPFCKLCNTKITETTSDHLWDIHHIQWKPTSKDPCPWISKHSMHTFKEIEKEYFWNFRATHN